MLSALHVKRGDSKCWPPRARPFGQSGGTGRAFVRAIALRRAASGPEPGPEPEPEPDVLNWSLMYWTGA
jgi:hypothetical protein